MISCKYAMGYSRDGSARSWSFLLRAAREWYLTDVRIIVFFYHWELRSLARLERTDDSRRDHEYQLRLLVGEFSASEKRAQNRNIAQDRKLCQVLGNSPV